MSQGATSNPARTTGSLALQNETRQTKSPMTNDIIMLKTWQHIRDGKSCHNRPEQKRCTTGDAVSR